MAFSQTDDDLRNWILAQEDRGNEQVANLEWRREVCEHNMKSLRYTLERLHRARGTAELELVAAE